MAPLDDDDDQKVSNVVADAARERAKVTGPERVAKAMDSLSITSFKGRDLKKLRANLEVDVIIHGSVTTQGRTKHLALTLSGKGKQKASLELDFKTTKALRKELVAVLGKKLDTVTGAGNDDDTDDDDEGAQHPFGDSAKSDDKPKSHADDDDNKPKSHAGDDDRPKKHPSDDDDDRPKKSSRTADADVRKHRDDDGDDHERKRKHHRDDDDDDAPRRNPITQAAVWFDAGGSFARHTLTWSGVTGKPPRVGTAAASAAIEAELYPNAFSSLKGSAAFGLYGDFGYAFGLGIAVPGTNLTVPIKQEHYQAGLRYRVVSGQSSIAFGAAYWRRTYIADHTNPQATLDMPDIAYQALAPGVCARYAAAPKVGLVLAADVPLMLDAGPIVKGTGYGAAKIIAFDVLAGVQIQVAPHYALQLRGDFNRDAFSFAAKPMSGAANRGVTAATEMNYGVAATLGILY